MKMILYRLPTCRTAVSMVKVLMMARTPSWPVRLHTTVWPLMYNSSSLHVSTLSRSSFTLTPPAPWNTHRSFCRHSNVQPFSKCQSSTCHFVSIIYCQCHQTHPSKQMLSGIMLHWQWSQSWGHLTYMYSLHFLVLSLRHITIKIVPQSYTHNAQDRYRKECLWSISVFCFFYLLPLPPPPPPKPYSVHCCQTEIR